MAASVNNTDDIDNVDDTTTEVENSPLGVSDEEFMTMAPPPVVTDADANTEEDADTDDDNTADADDTTGQTVEDGTPDNTTDTTDNSDKTATTAQSDTQGITTDDTKTVDYKAEYERLLAPFKANGVQVQAKSIDDVIALMQMGANYHKKMAGLKPSLKIVKLLEKNDLLDADKISYLIDLHTKNPGAIAKLVKDSGIDPLDMDTEAENKYVPKSRSVSDTELELDSVLESIQDTPTYNKTLTVLTKQWDAASRSVIAGNPHIISVINEQMANGIYDQVASAVEHERRFGRLQGLSDLDAYKHMGDHLEAHGLFAHQKQQTATQQTVAKPATPDDSARKERKKAVSPTRSSTGKTTPLVINPLAMSDEEFEKYDINHFK